MTSPLRKSFPSGFVELGRRLCTSQPLAAQKQPSVTGGDLLSSRAGIHELVDRGYTAPSEAQSQ